MIRGGEVSCYAGTCLEKALKPRGSLDLYLRVGENIFMALTMKSSQSPFPKGISLG